MHPHPPPVGPHAGHDLFLGAPLFLLTMLLIGATLFLLYRRGHLTPPPWIRQGPHSPEGEAKRILAARFAQSEISSEEFMERASVLNWTPGSESWPEVKTKKKRR